MYLYNIIARNALVVFVAAMLGYSLKIQPWFNNQISFINYNNGSLPPIQVPDPTSDICSVSASIAVRVYNYHVYHFVSGAWHRNHYGTTDQFLREYCNSQSIW